MLKIDIFSQVVLWDIVKGTVLKSLSEAHTSPIASVRFYHDREATVVSVDSHGCVNKLSFTKVFSLLL